jgi:Tfp pilus assembly protein PilF
MPGRLPDAVAQFESAVKLDPQSAAAQFCLGIGLARSGRRGEAEEHLQRSLEIRPDFEPARRALERLRSEGR